MNLIDYIVYSFIGRIKIQAGKIKLALKKSICYFPNNLFSLILIKCIYLISFIISFTPE